MIAKIIKGTRSSYGAIIRYILDDAKDTVLLNSEGVRLKDVDSIIKSFELQAEMNPRLLKSIYHIALAFSPNDSEIINENLMKKIASEYMLLMGLEKNTQFIVAAHQDKAHKHAHILCNRINNQGLTISDSNDRIRSEKICRAITLKYKLYVAEGKRDINENRLKEPDKTKYEIYKVLKKNVSQCQDWKELNNRLKDENIDMQFIYKGQSSVIQGITFSMNSLSYKGSAVDKLFSFSKIDFQLNQNMKQHTNHSFFSIDNSSQTYERMQILPKDDLQVDLQVDFPISISSGKHQDDDLNLKKKKKKKKTNFGISF